MDQGVVSLSGATPKDTGSISTKADTAGGADGGFVPEAMYVYLPSPSEDLTITRGSTGGSDHIGSGNLSLSSSAADVCPLLSVHDSSMKKVHSRACCITPKRLSMLLFLPSGIFFCELKVHSFDGQPCFCPIDLEDPN